MIPASITEDLRNGMGLEDCLIKHGTNLKDLFNRAYVKNSESNCIMIDEWTWIRPTKYNTYRISKYLDGRKVEFGTYKSHNDALIVRNELIKCGWNKHMLPSILERAGVVPNKRGGYNR